MTMTTQHHETLSDIDIVAISHHPGPALTVLRQSVANDERIGDVRFMDFEPSDVVVSPANTQGFMGGQSPNIDTAYLQMFGVQIQQRVQQEIDALYESTTMPFGKAFLIRSYPDSSPIPRGSPGGLIVSPTILYQETGMPPKAQPDIAGKALKAVLITAGLNRVKRLFIPPMGMGSSRGVEQVLPQFRKAFIEAFDEAEEYLNTLEIEEPVLRI
jgi:O-acetyl-ADP-ribose deacetylase (regulator of RNase III)